MDNLPAVPSHSPFRFWGPSRFCESFRDIEGSIFRRERSMCVYADREIMLPSRWIIISLYHYGIGPKLKQVILLGPPVVQAIAYQLQHILPARRKLQPTSKQGIEKNIYMYMQYSERTIYRITTHSNPILYYTIPYLARSSFAALGLLSPKYIWNKQQPYTHTVFWLYTLRKFWFSIWRNLPLLLQRLRRLAAAMPKIPSRTGLRRPWTAETPPPPSGPRTHASAWTAHSRSWCWILENLRTRSHSPRAPHDRARPGGCCRCGDPSPIHSWQENERFRASHGTITSQRCELLLTCKT